MLNSSEKYDPIIKACIRGNRKAQSELYERHKIYLFGVCQRYVKSREAAEDVLQEGFYKILKSLNQFRGDGDLRAWMRKIMVNTALMHLRKYGKMQFSNLEDIPLDHTNLTDNSLLENDRANAIIYLIRQLPRAYQTVFNLRGMEGFSFREISEELDINEATLRSHYMRARQHLQKLLHREMTKNG